MSNQLGNQFILNTSPQLALHDGIGLVAPQLLHSQVLSPATNLSASEWSSLASDATTDINNYGLLVNSDNNNQQVAFPAATLTPHLQDQSMSQTAQIVLLPTQSINLVANVPKQEQVQMILPNDVGYQLLTSIPNVSVLVPTNLLLANGYILINDTQNSSQSLALQCPASTQPSDPLVATSEESPTLYLGPADRTGEQTLIAANVEFEHSSPQHLAQVQECEYIALADNGTQTVLSAIPEAELNQTAHLISNNGQIVGIIGSDQLSLLQAESAESQVLIATCIDPHESIGLASGPVENVASYDINSILASTISAVTAEKSDQNQAKQWLKDSCIVNRALKALKKTSAGSHSHQHTSNRPHSQTRRG